MCTHVPAYACMHAVVLMNRRAHARALSLFLSLCVSLFLSLSLSVSNARARARARALSPPSLLFQVPTTIERRVVLVHGGAYVPVQTANNTKWAITMTFVLVWRARVEQQGNVAALLKQTEA